MSKKRADIQAISNELEGASLFFTKPTTAPLPTQLPRASKPEVIPTSSDSTPSEIKAKPERSDVRTDDGTFGRKKNRVQLRNAFDIHADQLRDLRTLQS